MNAEVLKAEPLDELPQTNTEKQLEPFVVKVYSKSAWLMILIYFEVN